MEFPKGGLIGKTAASVQKVRDMNIPTHAANAGYFIVLSVFPALVLLLSILRYTDLDAQDLMGVLEGILPYALLSGAERLIISTYAHASSAVVSVSALSALWSSSRGIYGILRGFNAIYGVQEDRGYWYTRGISVFYTFLLLVVLLLTLVMNVFSDTILAFLARNRWAGILTDVVNLRMVWLLLLQTALFSAMYMVFPNRKNRFRESVPGALLAAAGWMLFTQLFSWYVTWSGGYSGIYGSVYTVALSMLWLYFCMSILFGGAALNRILLENRGNVSQM